jgi:outer membrane efflux protein
MSYEEIRLMRRMVLLVSFALSPRLSAADSAALTFADIVQRATADPAVLVRVAGLARLQGELAATGRFTGQGPTLEAELGPRRMADGVRKLEASARVEVPIFSGSHARDRADSQLRGAGPDFLAADAVESRLRLREAYLDAWFEQERLAVLANQLEASEQVLASVRKRVEAGAEAPYEASLAEGEVLRARSESDDARSGLGDAWTALRALADLPARPQELASPGIPDLSLPGDADSRFTAGVLRRAAGHRESFEAAFLELDHARRRSRWSVATTVSKEADESFATIGAAYRFPRRGESAAVDRERAAIVASIDRGAEVETARLSTRFETAIERLKRFGAITPPDAFDDAMHAVALRMELGKERPSVALPVRRQLLEARGTALQRVRDAHLLIAEIGALIAGEAP